MGVRRRCYRLEDRDGHEIEISTEDEELGARATAGASETEINYLNVVRVENASFYCTHGDRKCKPSILDPTGFIQNRNVREERGTRRSKK